MKSFARPRTWVALLVGVAAGLLTHFWRGSPRLVMHLENTCHNLAFSPDSSKLAATDEYERPNRKSLVVVWDATTGELLNQFELGWRGRPSKVVFAPDGQTLGIFDAGVVTKLDLVENRVSARYDHAAWSHDPNYYLGRELLFSAEKRWLAHNVFEARLYDVETGQVVRDYAKPWANHVWQVHGGCVPVLYPDKYKTFDVRTGMEIGTFGLTMTDFSLSGGRITFNPDGSHALFISTKDEVVVHNGVGGTQCVLLQGYEWLEWGGDCWSPDNRFYAGAFYKPAPGPGERLRMWLGGATNAIHVFDTTTGREIMPPIIHCNRCCFSPDMKTLAVAQRGGKIALWDLPPPSRWPHVLIAAVLMTLTAFGIGAWCGRRRITPPAPLLPPA